MRNVSEQRPVLFVNSIGMRMPVPGRSPQAWRRILRKARSMLKLVRRPVPDLPDFHVMSPFILPAYGSPLGRRVNCWLVATQVKLTCRILGMPRPDIVVTIPTAGPVAARIPHRSLVLNRSDKHSAFPEVDSEFVRGLEDDLLRSADLVLYVSRALMDDEADVTGSRAHFLDHGVDLAHFGSPGPTPTDVAHLPSPRIGFFGGFDDYIIDFDLLERIAIDVPEAHLLLIGDATCPMDTLTRHPNVTWLGPRSYEDIPAYGSTFDVALMPWLQNDWIRYCNPIKMKEYLVLGLPIISTPFPEVNRFTDWVEVAADPEIFIKLVREALTDPGSPRPQLDTSDWSWAGRAAALLGQIDTLQRANR